MAVSTTRSLTRFLKRTANKNMTSSSTASSNTMKKGAQNDGSDHTAITEASSQSSCCSEFFGDDHAETTNVLRLEPPTAFQSDVLKHDNKSPSTSSQHSHQIARHIRFSASVEQRTILGRHEYSTSELDACWFRGDEYATITRSCCKQIEKLEAGENLRDQKFCSRGLESHTRLAALAKTQSRRNAWDAVLNEQYEQLSLGVVDDEPVAQLYQHASSSSLMWAQRVGLQDQKAAALVFDDLLDEVDVVNSSF